MVTTRVYISDEDVEILKEALITLRKIGAAKIIKDFEMIIKDFDEAVEEAARSATYKYFSEELIKLIKESQK